MGKVGTMVELPQSSHVHHLHRSPYRCVSPTLIVLGEGEGLKNGDFNAPLSTGAGLFFCKLGKKNKLP